MNLYISDLDGTLLNSDQVISETSIEILNKLIDKGLNFTVATARSYESSKKLLKDLNLRLPIILNNGAFIYDLVSGKNIVENYIQDEFVDFILRSYNEKGISPLISAVDPNGNKKIYYRDIYNKGQQVYIDTSRKNQDKRLTKVDNYLHLKDHKVINIFAIEETGILDFMDEFFRKNIDVSCHLTEEIYAKGFFWLEITNSKGSKKYAAEFLKKYLSADRLICFGDNLNDASIFKIADEKYAVENAYEALKVIATDIIKSNNEDGVAKFIQYHFKEN